MGGKRHFVLPQEEERRGVLTAYQEVVWWSEQRTASKKLPIANSPNTPAIVFRHLTGNKITFAGADMWDPRGTLLWQMPREEQTRFYYCAHRKRQASTASTAQRTTEGGNVEGENEQTQWIRRMAAPPAAAPLAPAPSAPAPPAAAPTAEEQRRHRTVDWPQWYEEEDSGEREEDEEKEANSCYTNEEVNAFQCR